MEGGFVNDPLDLAINIFDAAEFYLYSIDGLANSGPSVISKSRNVYANDT